MRRGTAGLVGVVLALNATLVVGALFSERALTIAVVFALDAVAGIARLLYERLAAERASTAPPAMTPLRFLEPLYEMVADKRGSVRVAARFPSVSPRNLPYVVDQWVVCFAVFPVVVLAWTALEPFEGGLGPTLLPAVLLVAAKHDRIVQTWAAAGRYATASPRTVRPSRDIVYSTVVACVAVWSLSRTPPDPAQVTAATALFCLPKFAFECRECGVGPWPLTFDPAGGATLDPLSVPDGPPRATVQNDRGVVRAWAIHDGLSYAVLFATSLTGFLGTVAVLGSGSLRVTLWAVAIALLAAPPVAVLTVAAVVWLGHANEEYRVYDDALVAYDSLLDEPQWVVPVEDISSVSVGDDPLGWTILGLVHVLPFETYPVVVERESGDDVRLSALADPAALASAVRASPRSR